MQQYSQKDREILYTGEPTEDEELELLAQKQSNEEVRQEMEVGSDGISDR